MSIAHPRGSGGHVAVTTTADGQVEAAKLQLHALLDPRPGVAQPASQDPNAEGYESAMRRGLRAVFPELIGAMQRARALSQRAGFRAEARGTDWSFAVNVYTRPEGYNYAFDLMVGSRDWAAVLGRFGQGKFPTPLRALEHLALQLHAEISKPDMTNQEEAEAAHEARLQARAEQERQLRALPPTGVLLAQLVALVHLPMRPAKSGNLSTYAQLPGLKEVKLGVTVFRPEGRSRWNWVWSLDAFGSRAQQEFGPGRYTSPEDAQRACFLSIREMAKKLSPE